MQKNKKNLRLMGLLAASGLLLGVTGCQSTKGCTADNTKCFNTAKKVFKGKQTPAILNPQFKYIKLTMNGKPLWLAQGSTEQWPTVNTKVFYSADRSVFKWANGRLTSVITPSLDWREHLDETVNWSTPRSFKFSRTVDAADGIVAMKEQREVVRASAPEHNNFVGDDTELVWMHEYTVAQTPISKAYPSFDNWYAFDSKNMKEPIYGQQCISQEYCLSWQVWGRP